MRTAPALRAARPRLHRGRVMSKMKVRSLAKLVRLLDRLGLALPPGRWPDAAARPKADHTISGPAAVTNDRKNIAELWQKTNAAWWDSADDPEIRMITVKPDEGELWDSHRLVVATARMALAAPTGSMPDVGDNAKVDLLRPPDK